MTTHHDDDPGDLSETLRRADQQIHIDRLRHQLEDKAGGDVIFGGTEELDPGLEAEFLERVLAFENAPQGTWFVELTKAGVLLPGPASLSDEEIAALIVEIAQKLAELRVFLYSTDHLTDRELYTRLVTDVLLEPTTILPPHPDSACHLDLIGSGSDEDTAIWLRYDADEAERRDWHAQFPEDPMPPHEDPPCNRDSSLPQREYH